MRIDSLKTAPDRAGRYWIQLSDGSRLGLYRQTVEDFALYPGMELSVEEWGRLQTAAGEMSAKMRAVRIVSASSVSRKDLEQRLVRKGEDPQQARDAVAWMEELHLVDDKSTAQQVVRSCIAKGYGPERAKQALYAKKIPDQIDWIHAFLRSRLDADSDEKQVKRAVDSLLRRGHHYSRIREALNSLSFDTDEFPEE